MSPQRVVKPDDLKLNLDNLYREETFTDLETGSIRRLTPIKPDGSPDPTRRTHFIGQTELMTRAGPLPLEMPIEAATLQEAAEKFGQAIESAMQRLAEQIERHQIEQASRLVVPSGPIVPGSGKMPPPPGGGSGNLIIP